MVPRLARGDLFGRHTRSYAAENSGQQITILQAGCTTAEDLDADPLRAAGARLSVSMIDEDNEVTRAAVAHHASMSETILGDLRTVPLPPRAYDIVQCSSLLGRIEHAELVLDRLSAAVKPGGLLLLRIRDRDSAAGFLDRVLPGPFRRAIWRKRQPGEPGPHVAVYERLASGRGVQAYVLMHGLVIAERGALGGLAGGLRQGTARIPHRAEARCPAVPRAADFSPRGPALRHPQAGGQVRPDNLSPRAAGGTARPESPRCGSQLHGAGRLRALRHRRALAGTAWPGSHCPCTLGLPGGSRSPSGGPVEWAGPDGGGCDR